MTCEKEQVFHCWSEDEGRPCEKDMANLRAAPAQLTARKLQATQHQSLKLLNSDNHHQVNFRMDPQLVFNQK